MSRYFIEVAYKGTAFSGFQIQDNALTIQAEVEKALGVIQRAEIRLTGSSRTDAGVHAYQNYFHFDYLHSIHAELMYKMNAILSPDIVVKKIHLMGEEAHCRFDAIYRQYIYRLHKKKDPFLQGMSYYFPYNLKEELIKEGIEKIKGCNNFYGFAKTNSQVSNYNCTILRCEWNENEEKIEFVITANRFLRGMVRMIMGCLLKLGRGQIDMNMFDEMLKGVKKSVYSAPAHGLYLQSVGYPENYFPIMDMDLGRF